MRTYINTFIICGLLFTTAYTAPTDEECDKSKCKGPLKFYEELSCTPVYKNEGDCCPYKYDCEHLKNRTIDKCYVNGREYNIGDQLKDEDQNACDIGCVCRRGFHGVPSFSCAIVDCFGGHYKPGCYRKRSPSDCCPGEEVCPEKPEDIPTCEVDGKTYKDGDYFTPAGEPNKSCYCMEGYAGKNVEPFCKTRASICGVQLRHAYEIHNNCPPVYYSTQTPQTDCAVAYRCQNNDDAIIKTDNSTDTSESKSASSGEEKSDSDEMMCKFGNLKMKLGEELNQATDYSSVCVKCTCEVPPVPTCQRLPDEECDVTKHPPFHQ